MHSQTIATAPSFTLPTVSAQAQKKTALSVAILAAGGILLVLFAALWMPTLMMIDMALTLGLVATVVTGDPVKSSAVFALKIAACMAVGAGYALVGLVLYTLYTF
jgi:hypothetical protein